MLSKETVETDSIRQIIIDPKLFEESFSYCRHFLAARVTRKDVGKLIKFIPLRRKAHKLFLDLNAKPRYSRDPESFKSGDWVLAVPMGTVDVHGRKYTELNFLANLLKGKDVDMAGLVKEFKRGISMDFTPCKCGSLKDLRIATLNGIEEIECGDCRKELTWNQDQN